MTRLFGTDGVRGTANVAPVSPEVVMALGRAAVQTLGAAGGEEKPRFLIGRDTRLSGSMLEAALVAGICSAGADAVLVGVLPTAAVAYLTRTTGATAGVMISASHNPFADNGIKFFDREGVKLADALEAQIEACLAHPPATPPPVGKAVGRAWQESEAAERYVSFLLSTFQHPLPVRLRIGLDCANGAASGVAPLLFTRLGAEVYTWQAAPDGCNINAQCGAVYPEFLRQQVLAHRLDLGFAFDGDADRLIAVDHTGRILDGDDVLAICARYLHARQALTHNLVISTIMANLGLRRALHRLGIALETTPVGDKYVFQAMRERGAVLGGEPSGHLIFRAFHTTGDGLLTAVQLLNAIVVQQAPLAELAAWMQKFPQVLTSVRIRKRQDPLSIPAVQQAVTAAQRALGDEGRVVVRLSGTEPVARVMVEGPDQAAVATLAHDIAQAITDSLGEPA